MLGSIKIAFKPYLNETFYENKDITYRNIRYMSVVDNQYYVYVNDKRGKYNNYYEQLIKEMLQPLEVLKVKIVYSKPFITFNVKIGINTTFFNLVFKDKYNIEYEDIQKFFEVNFGNYNTTSLDVIVFNKENNNNNNEKKLVHWIDEITTEEKYNKDAITIINLGLVFERIVKISE